MIQEWVEQNEQRRRVTGGDLREVARIRFRLDTLEKHLVDLVGGMGRR